MSSRPALWLGLWSLVLFTAALVLNTRSNDFPYFYHPDESVKVEQVTTGVWNFHHPMLLLRVAKAVVDGGHVSLKAQNVVEVGRWVSAVFTSIGIVALSLLAYFWRGPLACAGTGLVMLWHHQSFELSHYFKEDTALLFGLSLTFLATYLYWQKPSVARAIALGLAAGLAISGKYIGVFGLAVAIPAIWWAPDRQRRPIRLAAFIGALLVTLLVVNLPLVEHLTTFRQSFDREMNFVVNGQKGTTRSVPHALYWNVFRDNSTPVVWVLLLVFLFRRWRERRSLPLVEWLLIAFPFAYALTLSFSPKSNDRYFLPATGSLMLLAVFGALDAAHFLGRWASQRWIAPLLVAALVVAELPSWFRYDMAFQRDDNRELFDYVKTQLPPTAVIAKDSRIQLPDPEDDRVTARFGKLPQKIMAGKFAADVGTIDQMRQQGIEYAAVSESDYGRFRLKGLRPAKSEEKVFAQRKAFYEELLRDGVLLRDWERGTVLYLHPGIRLYRLPPAE